MNTAAMNITATTHKSVVQVREDLTKACAAHKFGVIGVIDLREKLKEKGVPHDRDVVVFEVCNPHHAKKALDANPEVSVMLPCRISVFQGGDGKTHLATARPSTLMAGFAAPGLEGVAAEVERTLEAIVKDAAR